MEIKLNKYYEEELNNIAKRYDVDPDILKDMYMDIMQSNFYEDLCDIARENEEELKVKE